MIYGELLPAHAGRWGRCGTKHGSGREGSETMCLPSFGPGVFGLLGATVSVCGSLLRGAMRAADARFLGLGAVPGILSAVLAVGAWEIEIEIGFPVSEDPCIRLGLGCKQMYSCGCGLLSVCYISVSWFVE